MTDELDALNALHDTIVAHINEYLPESLDDLSGTNVLIDFPDVDKMAARTMIYIQPDYAEFTGLTTSSDDTSFRVSVFVLNKRDTRENLTIQNFGYYAALTKMLRSNCDLDGAVAFVEIVDVNFYPAVEGNPNVRGAELSLSIKYEKEYD